MARPRPRRERTVERTKAFDRDLNHDILTKVPFADHNAMLDPSCPDITARVLEALGQYGIRVGYRQVDRGIPWRLGCASPIGPPITGGLAGSLRSGPVRKLTASGTATERRPMVRAASSNARVLGVVLHGADSNGYGPTPIIRSTRS